MRSDVTLAWVAAFAALVLFGAASWNDAQVPMPPEPTSQEVAELRSLDELGCFEDEIVVRVVATWQGDGHGYDDDRTGALMCVPVDTKPATEGEPRLGTAMRCHLDAFGNPDCKETP